MTWPAPAPTITRLTPDEALHQTRRLATRIATEDGKEEQFIDLIEAVEGGDELRALFLAMNDPGLAIAYVAWRIRNG